VRLDARAGITFLRRPAVASGGGFAHDLLMRAFAWILIPSLFACTSESASPASGAPSERPKPPDLGPVDPGETPAPVTCSGAPGELYALTVKKLAFTEQLPFCTLKGEVLLLVNGASSCGYTPQYAPLQRLHEKHKAKGFSVVAFPSDSFNQELEDEAKVSSLCTDKYGITFPLAAIGPVIDNKAKGETAQPVFQWLYAQPGMSAPVAWNFEKFLVGRDGKVVKRWKSAVSPDEGSEIDLAIQAELAK